MLCPDLRITLTRISQMESLLVKEVQTDWMLICRILKFDLDFEDNLHFDFVTVAYCTVSHWTLLFFILEKVYGLNS